MKKVIGFALLVMGLGGMAFAVTAVPEVDASTAVSAVTLLTGAALVIRGRKK
jgi:hypothetical protein